MCPLDFKCTNTFLIRMQKQYNIYYVCSLYRKCFQTNLVLIYWKSRLLSTSFFHFSLSLPCHTIPLTLSQPVTCCFACCMLLSLLSLCSPFCVSVNVAVLSSQPMPLAVCVLSWKQHCSETSLICPCLLSPPKAHYLDKVVKGMALLLSYLFFLSHALSSITFPSAHPSKSSSLGFCSHLHSAHVSCLTNAVLVESCCCCATTSNTLLCHCAT